VGRIDALRNEDQADAQEGELLRDSDRVGEISRDAAAVVDEHDLEAADRRSGQIEEPRDRGPVESASRAAVVRADLVLCDFPALSGRVFAALSYLVVDRRWTLGIGRIAGIDGAMHQVFVDSISLATRDAM